MNWGSYMHSHALHFYFLAAPDFIAGKDRKTRNVFQIIKDAPDVALQAIELRKNALDIVKATGGRPIHPTSSTPGGISTELDDETQKDLLKKAQRNVELAEATLELAKPIFEENLDLVKESRYTWKPTTLVWLNNGVWDVYDGDVRMKDEEGKIYAEFGSENYLDYMAENVKPYSWLKFPYIKDLGYPEGIYRVAPLSRLNVADKMPDTKSPGLLQRIQRHLWIRTRTTTLPLGKTNRTGCSSRMCCDALEGDLSGQKFPGPIERQAGEGVGIVEASRGTLTHHYA